MIKNKANALAVHLMFDIAELKDYRYHYGHTSQPVYAFDNAYYCATKGTQKPATHRDDAVVGITWSWQEVPDSFVNSFGYKIWKSVN